MDLVKVLDGFTVLGDSNARNLCSYAESQGVHLHTKVVKGGWTFKDVLTRTRRMNFDTDVLVICGINDVRKIKASNFTFTISTICVEFIGLFRTREENNEPLISLSCVQERVANALGISPTTVKRIKASSKRNPVLSSPGKSRPRNKPKTENLPDTSKMLIRNTLYIMYSQRKHVTIKLVDSGWLSMKNRRILQCQCLFHKILLTKTPAYLYNKITFRTDVPVRNPNRLTDNELLMMAQAIHEEESEEEVGGEPDTSSDEAVEESDHDTESEIEIHDLEDANSSEFESDDDHNMWSYEKDQERLLRLLQEVGTEVEPFDDESDEEEVDQEILSDHDSESEQSVSDVATRDEFVKTNSVIRFGKGTPIEKQDAWLSLTAAVNAVGGAEKSVEGWKKAYTEWKSHIRAKIRKKKELNEIEKKCVAVAALDKVTSGSINLPELEDDTEETNENTEEEMLDKFGSDVEVVYAEEDNTEVDSNRTPSFESASVSFNASTRKFKKDNTKKTPRKMLDEYTQLNLTGMTQISNGLLAIADAINNLANTLSNKN
ncbi:hypothetical protein FQR65_LT15668 [Abscondita terminalis]|nr:hypothetical protein FQR65_LT15668 [Abscondita terminalis]